LHQNLLKRGDFVTNLGRSHEMSRKTTETEIFIKLNLDGSGKYDIDTKIGFFDHMLELFAKHSSIDLTIKATGDTHIDYHHTVEDIGITLGEIINKVLGDKRGIARYGFFLLPMDETLIEVALDFSGRTHLNFDVDLYVNKVGNFDTELTEEFFKAFSDNAKMNLHIIKRYGKNSHHIIEGIFKAVARAMKVAIKIENDEIPSTKGVL
jgi:imidazoleglycerol-phosphate dehydratase